MASSGYLLLNDGILPDSSVGSDLSSFELGLSCSAFAANAQGVHAGFSKSLRRVASSRNPIRNAKLMISSYAGCDEASIVRKRVIAMSKIRLSVSGEEFRFRLPE